MRRRHVLPEVRLAVVEQVRAANCHVLGEVTMFVLDNPVFDKRRSTMFADQFSVAAGGSGAGCWAAGLHSQPPLPATVAGATIPARKDGEWLH